MKSLIYAVLCLAALIGSALAHFHLPKCYLELKTYLKVSAAEFAVMREEALSLAAEKMQRSVLGALKQGASNSLAEVSQFCWWTTPQHSCSSYGS